MPARPAMGPPQRVVYLLGAGATQACVTHRGGTGNLLMSGLTTRIASQLREIIQTPFADHEGLARLMNAVVDEGDNLDFEQLITFLDESPTPYREFALHIRRVFSDVLQAALDAAVVDVGPSLPDLYAALIDMHAIPTFNEELSGLLTLNYDTFIEDAIGSLPNLTVDFGVRVGPRPAVSDSVRLLKLHGSFGWSASWPMEMMSGKGVAAWIPPGIRKSKADYPFNAIWGLARELLDCDLLRIIGCNLGPNDWDLVSLLFSTRHTRTSSGPYTIEVISGWDTFERIRRLFPYLEVVWLPELPTIGPRIVGDSLGTAPQAFSALDSSGQDRVLKHLASSVQNPFAYWLTQMGEYLTIELDSIATTGGAFELFVAAETS